MKRPSRNLLVMLKGEFISEQAIEQEMEYLHEILVQVESPEQFCIAHELVDRNRITSNKKKILKEAGNSHLREFRFLINKN